MATGSSSRRVKNVVALTLIVSLGAILAGAQTRTAPNSERVRLTNQLPPIVSVSQPIERVDSRENITLALALPLRNQAQLTDLLHRLYDPRDPLYGRYLTA